MPLPKLVPLRNQAHDDAATYTSEVGVSMVPIAPTQVSPVQGVEVNCCAINELYNNYCCATSGQHCLQYLNLIFNLPIYVYKRDGIHSGQVPFGLMHLGPGPDPFGPIHLGYGPNLIGPIHLDTGRLGMFI